MREVEVSVLGSMVLVMAGRLVVSGVDVDVVC